MPLLKRQSQSLLKILELQVLNTLMNSSLEQALSDELLGSLHGASMQKASIKRRLTFITKMHRKILQMRDTHRNAAVICVDLLGTPAASEAQPTNIQSRGGEDNNLQ